MDSKYPIRVTCVWPTTASTSAPSRHDWLGAVRLLMGQQVDLEPSSASFHQVSHHTVVGYLDQYVDRQTRKTWTKQLEAMFNLANLAVSVQGGDLAVSGPKLVICDADSTLFTCEVIEEIAAFAGTKERVVEITAAAMRGEIDFAQSLQQRVATFAGLEESVLNQVRQTVNFSAGALTMVEAFHACGAKVGVVSGGFMEVVAPLAREAGLDHVDANRLEIQSGKLTGRLLGPIVTGQVKAENLVLWASEDGIEPDQCIAIGDGANDLQMIQAAGLGIAYCAKPILAQAADSRIPFANLAAAADLTAPTGRQV